MVSESVSPVYTYSGKAEATDGLDAKDQHSTIHLVIDA